MADSKRKFTIRPYRMNLMETSDAVATWNIVANAIDEIYNRNASKLSFEELYRSGYNLVLHKHGNILYEGVCSKIAQHLINTVSNDLQFLNISTTNNSTSTTTAANPGTSTGVTTFVGKRDPNEITNENSSPTTRTTNNTTANTSTTNFLFLDAVANLWNEHTITMIMIRDILMYMDRTFVIKNKRRPVYDLGLHLFRITVWEHPAVRSTVIELVLHAIQQERNGYILDDNGLAIRHIISMLLELGRADYSVLVYQEDFERIFLSTTQEYYLNESLHYISISTASEYVQKANDRIEQEKTRSITLQLPISTTVPLQTIIYTEWIERHAQQLVLMDTTGFASLLHRAGTTGTGSTTSSTSTATTGTVAASNISPGTSTIETAPPATIPPATATATTTTTTTGTTTKTDENSVLYDMREMYELFTKVPHCVDYLRDALSEQIKKQGRQLIHDQMIGIINSTTFITNVLYMRQQYDTVVTIAFNNEKKIQKRMKESFEDFLNIDARAASCLAIYVDEYLRVGLRTNNTTTNDDRQINNELNKVIIIFRYLSDKDVFESFYKQHLAKRLLGNKSISDDAERSMVSLLKAECGYQFTTKLEGMFNDMRISRETRDKFKLYKRTTSISTTTQSQSQSQKDNKNNTTTTTTSSSSSSSNLIDIEVDVLTTGYWPSQNVPPCTLPIQIQDAIEQFSTFYLEKHTGRKLLWQTSTGAAEVRATFGYPPTSTSNDTTTGTTKKVSPLRHYELCISTYQMCILLLFNENNTDTLTLGQIRMLTHIPDIELRRHLISLCTPKNKILKKGSKGKSIDSDADTFTYNNDFTSKLKRIKIQLVKETSILSNNNNNNTTNNASNNNTSTSTMTSGGGTAGQSTSSMIGSDTAAGTSAALGGGGGDGSSSSLLPDCNNNNNNRNMMRSVSNVDNNNNISSTGIPITVEEDRRHLVEAAIVRIMKARRTLHHNDLIAEVTKQLSIRFIPTPIFIKKRVESLIDREYLERDEQNHRLYIYVA